jgi:2,3-diketo-5-methylthio-1-phosphopentane phosphatase
MSQRPIVFLDFDGTITRNDVVDSILKSYANPTWLVIEEEWKAGRIGSRECLRAQMGLVRAKPQEVDALLDTIEVDEGFPALLGTCARHGVATHVISDGFDYCIARILGRPSLALTCHLDRLQIFASHLEPCGESWHVEFPYFKELCAHGCATCKPAVMHLVNPDCAPTIFVGDSLSDRYAASSADLVFGKGLAEYCQECAVPQITYTDLADVVAQLDLLLSLDFASVSPRGPYASVFGGVATRGSASTSLGGVFLK